MQYGSNPDQFFFLGTTMSISFGSYAKKTGFLFSTDDSANHCGSSILAVGSYGGGLSNSDETKGASAPALSLVHDGRSFLNYAGTISANLWLGFYQTVGCTDTVSALTVDPPVAMPTTWT